MDDTIHLVLVSNTAAPQMKKDGDPKEVLAQRFPNSLIDEFSFLDSPSNNEFPSSDSFSMGKENLYERSNVLLEQLCKSRKSRDSSKSRIVFLAHGFGGFIVKQAIISAIAEERYRAIARYTSTILFFGTPHCMLSSSAWRKVYGNYLRGSLLPAGHHAERLLEELEDNSLIFKSLCCNFNIVNFYEAEVEDDLKLPEYCHTLCDHEAYYNCDCGYEKLWEFDEPGFNDDVCEEIQNRSLSSTSCDFENPLNVAILRYASLTTILNMLENRARLRVKGRRGRLPIHAAAINGRLDVFQALVSAGADIDALDEEGRSTLMHAVADNNLKIVEYLLVANDFFIEDVEEGLQTPLILAAMNGTIEIVTMLLENKFSQPEILNARDYEGKTALVHAIFRNDIRIIKKLLDSGADPRVADCRERSALYWAARVGYKDTLNAVIEVFDQYCYSRSEIPTKYWEVATHGAVAQRWNLKKLLENEHADVEYVGPDGWSPIYTARSYRFSGVQDSLRNSTIYPLRIIPPEKGPSCWHSNDKSPGLNLEADGTTLSTSAGGIKFLPLGSWTHNGKHGGARADYPMLPIFKDIVYYFEIKLNKVSKQGSIAIGFCEDKAPLYKMLGRDNGSFGFYSRNGRLYDGRNDWKKIPYSTPYGAGDVIGCGVNFEEDSAFYTRNGKVIGQAFRDIRGKLYPAVSMNITQEGWEISAMFSKDPNDFMYQGDFESDTLTPVDAKEVEGESGSSDSENDYS